MISQEMIRLILARYTLPLGGTHGVPHWVRVLENGRRLSKVTGAKIDVVELFTVFHDSRQINEGVDDSHDLRGAEFARELRGAFYELDEDRSGLLVQACWDADRLDLGRVGIIPRHEKLCTDGPRDPDLLKWAMERSERLFVPALVSEEWKVQLGQ